MITFIKKNFTTEENLRDAFKVFDQDQDGFIGANDLREIMTNLGEKVTDEDIDEMIREADLGIFFVSLSRGFNHRSLDKDFKVNFREFQRIMSFRWVVYPVLNVQWHDHNQIIDCSRYLVISSSVLTSRLDGNLYWRERGGGGKMSECMRLLKR